VLGPHVNGPWLNLLTGVIIAGLIALSMLLTVTVLFPSIGSGVMIAMLAAGALCAAVFGFGALASRRKRAGAFPAGAFPDGLALPWRMAPLSELPAVAMTPLTRCGMILLRAYLAIAAGLVLLRIVQLALNGRV